MGVVLIHRMLGVDKGTFSSSAIRGQEMLENPLEWSHIGAHSTAAAPTGPPGGPQPAPG
jgi:hypothetical protein